MGMSRSPRSLGRADVRRCGTLWYATAGDAAPPHPPAGMTIRPVQPGDVTALRQAMIAASADDPGLAAIRLQGNRLGFLVETASTIAGAPEILAYGWIARAGDSVDDLGFPLEMPATEGWIYDCATVPSARGRGLYTQLLQTMHAALSAYGMERAWIGTAPQNWPSQRGIARAGFQKVADVDWSGDTAGVYGVRGMPDAVLYVLAATMGAEGQVRVVPDAGIPWIEAVVTIEHSATAQHESPGLARVRHAYGDQIHWTVRTTAEVEPAASPVVSFHAEGRESRVLGSATFDEYDHALAEVAPGLPWLADDEAAG